MKTLYNYFRSSASYRVRIALNLKKLNYEEVQVHLIKDGGQQHLPDFKKLNPQGLVPVFVDEMNANCITQSMSILEYLEEVYPQISLLPKDAESRAWVRSFAQSIACDIHPISNLRVLQYLQSEFKITEEQKVRWIQHWIAEGFQALETMLVHHKNRGEFCHGTAPTFADICLVPQVYNAQRYQCDLSLYPTITSISKHCESLSEFKKAYPIEPEVG